MNNMSTTANYCAKITFKSIHSEFKKTLTFFIVPAITDLMPSETIPRERLNIPPHLNLADPEFHKPAKIDMLIGAGPTLSMLSIGQIKPFSNEDFIIQKTKLGWIVGGGLTNCDKINSSKCMFTTVEFDLEKFWALEEINSNAVNWSDDEKRCEEHFRRHVTRNAEGRYVVALPFRDPVVELFDSKNIAEKRLQFLIKRFKFDHTFKTQYSKVMDEYIELFHMTPVTESAPGGFHLPHHAVHKESSTTTQTRVVFDPSLNAKKRNDISKKKKSLNESLLVGPTIQDDLFTLLLRFRTHVYVIIADIEKMYRQFLIREEDRKYQKVLWIVDEKIREFTLNTVTFGVASAPFLAIRCLHQLADDEREKFPLAAKILESDMYVDNMLTGTDSVEEAREICHQMSGILKTACLKMRQWASNEPSVLSEIEEKDLDANFSFNENSSLKTLGIFWKAKDDQFIYEIKQIEFDGQITKRKILSDIAKIFDPLGLLGPIILFAKKIMQEIWQSKIEWDESVPSNIYYSWKNFCMQLNSIDKITFDRHALIKDACEIELHGFADASQVGYGACIYIRTKDSDNNYHTSLFCSKSRVAPLKTTTIPRLELCAMLLLANLYKSVSKAINIKIDNCYFWSDSSIALNWINTAPNLLKTFVANRVSEIQTKTNVKNWSHVQSHDNPADALSRGQLPLDFLENSMWTNGPSWLKYEKSHWPISNIPGLNELPEKKKALCLIISPHFIHLSQILTKYSDFAKLKRIVAYCFRIKKKYRKDGAYLFKDDLQRAETMIIKLVQRSAFSNELQSLEKKKPLSEKNQLASLDPFLDDQGVIRVGGRIRKAIISYSTRHPIILPRGHHVTDLIIRHYHLFNLHTGVQGTLYAIREKYWPIDARNQIKRVLHKCVACFRAKPKLVTYKMGNLPSVRVRQSRPFNHVGVDYCGPFHIKEKRYRNKKMIKCYVAVFICMTVKAIHIEVVEDLSTNAFLGALRRFISRRGLPQTIHSDNGTNFQGARNELNELYELLNSDDLKDNVNNFASHNQIEWHFIPPHAPNFGGLWEAAVKQFKHHFKRVAYDKRFTLAEFSTFTCEVEAILNSRPLTQMSADINDLSVLTPGHFLIGDSIKSLPEPDYRSLPVNRLNAWEHISQVKQQFWKRWHAEYLSDLNVRHKRTNGNDNVKLNQLVLIKEDNLPSLEWSLGRIVELHPGTDGIVRTVSINTKNGIKKRPTSKIAVLPIETSIATN